MTTRPTFPKALVLSALLVVLGAQHASANASISNSFLEAYLSSTGRIGLNTTGGDPANPQDDDKRMLYFESGNFSGVTSFEVLRVEEPGQQPLQIYMGEPFFGFGRVTQPPTAVSADQIASGFQAFGIQVDKTMTFTDIISGRPDQVEFRYVLTNTSNVEKAVGFQIMFDTMIGNNDGAPINLTGIPFSRFEQQYIGPDVPAFWYALEGSIAQPGMTVQGTNSGYEATPPDRFGIANYFNASLSPWSWIANPATAYVLQGGAGDSAVQLFWDTETLAPGQSKEIVTYYGLVSLTTCESALDVSMAGPTFFKNTCAAERGFSIDVQVSNSSGAQVTGVEAQMDLAPGLVFVASGTATENVMLPDLNPGDLARYTFDVKADSSVGGPVNADLQVSADGGIVCNSSREHELNSIAPCTPAPGTPTFTPTPTPTQGSESPTPTPTMPPTDIGVDVSSPDADVSEGEDLIIDITHWNFTSTPEDADLYVAVEIAGVFYFHPTYTEAAAVAQVVRLNAQQDRTFELLRLPITTPIAATIPLTWYAALLEQSTGALLGDLASTSTRLVP